VSPRWLLRRTIRRLGRRKLAFVGLAAAFAALAALGAGARMLGRQSAGAAARLTAEAHVIAYLHPGLDRARTQALVASLARLPSVAEVREVDGRRALAQLAGELRTLGESPALLAGVEGDLLPASLEVVLQAGPELARRAAEVAIRMRRLEGVAAVDAMTEGLARVAGFEQLARRLAGFLALAAALAALALGAGIVAHERTRQREETEALALSGATSLALRVPAGVVGALAATAGGLVGLAVGTRLALLLFAGSAGSAGLPPRELLGGWAALALLGLVIGWLSVPRTEAQAAG
jgi:cell division transport system permease protein